MEMVGDRTASQVIRALTEISLNIKAQYQALVQTAPTRAYGTIYQNTTGRTLFVSVSGRSAGAATLTAKTDNSATPITKVVSITGTAAADSAAFFLVMPNNYYLVNWSAGAKTLTSWIEWY